MSLVAETETCPECGSDDLKAGVVPDPTRPFREADRGCRECGHLWDLEGEGE